MPGGREKIWPRKVGCDKKKFEEHCCRQPVMARLRDLFLSLNKSCFNLVLQLLNSLSRIKMASILAWSQSPNWLGVSKTLSILGPEGTEDTVFLHIKRFLKFIQIDR